MRKFVFSVTAAALLASLVSPASAAQRRIFIVANDADGYGIDRCLAGGERCGAAVANAYCRSQSFATAASYRKVDREDITGAIPTDGVGNCHGGRCAHFVAIVCTR
ncbi:MAG TPA: hypothetical protein VFT69_14945 [Pseudolabrys sp.]|jgi:hypothetical protein|nr:hypothetical protein [Pseudolabrys sp.]